MSEQTSGTAGTQRADLSEDGDVVASMLRAPLDWRVRVVEHIDLDTATTCLRRRSLQCAPIRPVLPAGTATSATTALVSVYYASVPRGPLLDLDIEGPGGREAFLLPRTAIAVHEARLLQLIAADAGIALEGDTFQLLTALLAHSTTPDEIAGARPALSKPAEYLAAGFGQSLPTGTVTAWTELDREAESLLRPFADETESLSPTEHPLLGLASLEHSLSMHASDWWRPVDRALKDYLALLRTAASTATDESAALEFMNSVADYGRNYDLLAVTEVPLDEPFVVKYRERRDLRIRFTGRVEQNVVLSDALTNHVVLSVADSSVQIREVEAVGPGGVPAYGAFTTRESLQTYAVYAHQLDRDYRVSFHFRLTTLRRLRWTSYAAAALLCLVTLAIGLEHPHRLADLAIIVGPSSLAASVLLIREPTTLSSRLRHGAFLSLATALAALLTVSVLSYLWPTLVKVASLVWH